MNSSRRILFLLALLPALAWAAPVTDYLGKTAFQVVAMGRQKWFEFYTGKEGESTLAMSSAEGLYGEALTRVNEFRMRKLSAARKVEIGKLRERLRGIAADSITLGRVRTGGGTMWNPVSAGITADVEEAVALWISKTGNPEVASSAEVEKLLTRLEMDLQAQEAEIAQDTSGLGLSFDQVERIFRRFRDRVHSLCSGEAAKTPREEAILLAFAKKMARRPFI